MAKRLMILVGTLAMLLAAAVPAFAQDRQVEVTGTIGDFYEYFDVQPGEECAGNPCPPYVVVDEASGVPYGLYNDQDLGSPDQIVGNYEGQRVTIEGTVRVQGFEGGPTLLNVTGLELANGGSGNGSSGNSRNGSGNSSSGSGGSSGGGSPSSDGGSSSSGSSKSNPAGGSSSGGSSSGSSSGAKASGAKAKELPKTGGGTLPALGLVGTLLVGGGFLIRRAAR